MLFKINKRSFMIGAVGSILITMIAGAISIYLMFVWVLFTATVAGLISFFVIRLERCVDLAIKENIDKAKEVQKASNNEEYLDGLEKLLNFSMNSPFMVRDKFFIFELSDLDDKNDLVLIDDVKGS